MTPGDDETLRLPRPGVAAEGQSGPGLSAGARIGEYVVLEVLGTGAHGGVYLAEHRLLGRRAAVKVLHREAADSPELTARFVREARAVNQIHHPGIVDVYDLGALPDGRSYCVMEFLPGRTLSEVIAERAPLSPPEAVAYLAPLCEALEAAHAAGVVHRDVKGSNVMVLDEGVPPRLKLLDFGVAKVVDAGGAGLTAVGQRLGTPSSMAPEQILGQPVDARTDVYALGVLLFQLLTGSKPFGATAPEEVQRQHLEVPPPRPSALAPVPPAFDAVVARALEKPAARRWPSALALLEAAREALGTGSRAPRRPAPAVAVHVAIQPAGPPGPDAEAALLAQADAAEFAEAALRQAGFELVQATPAALLGVRLLPPGGEAARLACAEALAVARAVAVAPEAPGVDVAVCVHAAEAEVRDTSGGPEIVGGPVCRVAEWVTAGRRGFGATEAALALAGAAAP
jgi:serine/threonine-protein kinase